MMLEEKLKMVINLHVIKEKAKQIHIETYETLLELIDKEQENPRRQAFSKFCLGAYYYFGFGNIEKDDNKAFELIHDCAMQGHLPAIYDLGANFYYNGRWNREKFEIVRVLLKDGSKCRIAQSKSKI